MRRLLPFLVVISASACDGCITGDETPDAGPAASSSSSGAASSAALSSSGPASTMGGSSSAGLSSSSSAVMATCESYCTTLMAACTGANAQYPSQEFCLAACATAPHGSATDTTGDTFSCRAYHANAASMMDPATHCPHAGPFGGNTCGNACEHYCDVVESACTGGDALYNDRASCLSACNGMAQDGSPTASVGDNVQCRAYHATLGIVLGSESVKCPSAKLNSNSCFEFVVNNVPVTPAIGFDSGSDDDRIRINIRPNAVDVDSVVTVKRVTLPPDPPSNIDLASAAFTIAFLPTVTLAKPILVEFPISPAPVHPQLAEVHAINGTTYTPLPSFYRASTNTVVAQVTSVPITIVAVLRTLQAETGTAVTSGTSLFMHETFGNEAFFSGAMGLHEIVPYLPPSDAVAMGVQIDINDVPDPVAMLLTGSDLAAKDDALEDPAVTNALLRGKSGMGPGAVIGVQAFYDATAVHECPGPDGADLCPTSIGLSCALCHVTVTPTTFALTAGMVALPIGQPRFDGIPNKQMNAGAILALTPYAQDNGLETLLSSWGPGRFDVRALVDNPLDDMVDNPTDTPPLFNFVDLDEQHYAYDWDGLFQDTMAPHNALASQSEAVYDLVMHANGAFGTASGTLPPELSITPPQSLLNALGTAETGAPGNDVTPASKLTDVQSFERSITSPAPGTFTEASAERGWTLFFGRARCSTCHSSPEFTGPGRFTITASNTGALAAGIKVAPLRGISTTAPYFHDQSAPDLAAVIQRYIARNDIVPTDLTAQEQADLVEYLKSL